VVEGDIRACFDNVDHQLLMSRLRRRITDRKLLRLVRQFLRAGIITEFGQRQSTLTGTPQGGILSPLLANLYLSILDKEFERRWQDMSSYPSRRQYLRKKGLPTYRLVRYADVYVQGRGYRFSGRKRTDGMSVRDTAELGSLRNAQRSRLTTSS